MHDTDADVFTNSNNELTLTNWPLVQDGWRSLFYVLLTSTAVLVTAYVSGSRPAAVVSTVVIGISTWRFWLPVQFQFTYAGIVQNCLGRRRLIPWRTVRRCEALRHGVLLYFTTDRSALAYLSTLFIDWRDRQNEVLQRIETFTRPSNSGARKSSDLS